MNPIHLDNPVATSTPLKTDVLVHAAIDDATGNNNSVLCLFWVLLVVFFVAYLVVRRLRGSAEPAKKPECVKHIPLDENIFNHPVNRAEPGFTSGFFAPDRD